MYISAEDPALTTADGELTEQTTTTGVARVEDWGPILTDQLPRFLAHSKVIENLGPLSRKAHRAKTHGRWKLEQPTPGTFHWTSPHGYQYQVTPTGTIRIRVPEQARGF